MNAMKKVIVLFTFCCLGCVEFSWGMKEEKVDDETKFLNVVFKEFEKFKNNEEFDIYLLGVIFLSKYEINFYNNIFKKNKNFLEKNKNIKSNFPVYIWKKYCSDNEDYWKNKAILLIDKNLNYDVYNNFITLIKIDDSLAILKKNNINVNIIPDLFHKAKKIWNNFQGEDGKKNWEKAKEYFNKTEENKERREKYRLSQEKRVEAAKNYKFQYFKFSGCQDSLATALSLLKAKLLSLAKQLKNT